MLLDQKKNIHVVLNIPGGVLGKSLDGGRDGGRGEGGGAGG